MKKKYKVILGTIALLLVAGLAISQALQGMQVEVQEVTRQTLTRSFMEEGIVTAPQELRMRPPHPAQISGLHVREGSSVETGEVLATLDFTEQEHTLKQLKAQLQGLSGEKGQLLEPPSPAEIQQHEASIQQAQSDLEIAREQFHRKESLYENQVLSFVDLETAENHYHRARINLEQQKYALDALMQAHQPTASQLQILDARRESIEAQIAQLHYQMDQMKLTAPFSGIVAAVPHQVHDQVGPESTVIHLFDPEELHVETQVLTRDVADLNPGMAVNLTWQQPQQDITFPGTIISISPHAEIGLSPLGLEEDRVKVTILPDLPEAIQLGPGYRLDVTFVTESEENQLGVPRTALFTRNDKDALFVAENGRAVVRTVATGLETRREVAIQEGLEEGDLVILDPQTDGLTEGSRVSPSQR